DVDLDAFLAKSHETESSMAGSAILQWPEEPREILGLKLLLIRKMSVNDNFAFNFCHTLFYHRQVMAIVRQH
ncbi:hypothetical protein ACLBPT_31850, partial [Klebsiella pneumoniae]